MTMVHAASQKGVNKRCWAPLLTGTISEPSGQLYAMVDVVPFYRQETKAPRDPMTLPRFHCELGFEHRLA